LHSLDAADAISHEPCRWSPGKSHSPSTPADSTSFHRMPVPATIDVHPLQRHARAGPASSPRKSSVRRAPLQLPLDLWAAVGGLLDSTRCGELPLDHDTLSTRWWIRAVLSCFIKERLTPGVRRPTDSVHCRRCNAKRPAPVAKRRSLFCAFIASSTYESAARRGQYSQLHCRRLR
jgi:hypothetical protein